MAALHTINFISIKFNLELSILRMIHMYVATCGHEATLS